MGLLMSAGRKTFAVTLTAAALGGAFFIPAADSFAAQGLAMIATPEVSKPQPQPGQSALPQAPEAGVTATSSLEATIAEGQDAQPAIDESDPELVCMAKVVRHEAANQSRTGQLAVAQLIMNRLRSPLFPKTVCGVVHQPGQFFNTNSYHPSRADRLWKTALEVSVDARRALTDSVIGKAIYYNAAYGRSAFHAGRKHAATIGDHAFYF